jgi:benzil reductase ((S)-benzoin forming)
MISPNDIPLASALGNKVVILTGPTSGLGLAIFELLQEHGTPTVAVGRMIDRLAETPSENRVEQTSTTLVSADFSSAESSEWIANVREGFEKLLGDYSDRTAILINNAATIEPIQSAVSLDQAALRRSMQINFGAPVALASALVDIAVARNRQLRIVNITTGAARRPIAGWLPYCASKAACRIALDVLSLENPGIELLHYDPGVIDTQMQMRIRNARKVLPHGLEPLNPSALRTPREAALLVVEEALKGQV